jgi:hypothetical protein
MAWHSLAPPKGNVSECQAKYFGFGPGFQGPAFVEAAKEGHDAKDNQDRHSNRAKTHSSGTAY